MLPVFMTTAACQRLADIEGIGPMSATVLQAAVPQPQVCHHGRHLAAWLGWVPRQHATGGKALWLGISTRGDRSRRALLMYGARAVVYRWKDKHNHGARARWVPQRSAKQGSNGAPVALAHKSARVAWVLLSQDVQYQSAG